MPSSIFFLKSVFRGLLTPGDGRGLGTFSDAGDGRGVGFVLLAPQPGNKNKDAYTELCSQLIKEHNLKT